MKKQTVFLAAALSALALAAPTQAAVSVSSSSFVYNQSFDSLAKTTSTNNVGWANDSTLLGWSLFKKNDSVITTYLADAGASATGAFRSFGANGNADRALGGVGSNGSYFAAPSNGAVAGSIALSLTNNSGSALDGFKLAFDGEQWRNGGNSPGVAQSMDLQYGFGATFASVAWNTPGGNFNWSSPVFASSTAAAVNGNTVGLVANRGGQINTSWANGATLWIRWIERNDFGSDHGLAIDNVKLSVIPAAVPEPQTYALLLAGLGALGFVARRRKA